MICIRSCSAKSQNAWVSKGGLSWSLYLKSRTRTSNFGLKVPEETFLFTHLESQRLIYSNGSHREIYGDGRVCEKSVLSEILLEEIKASGAKRYARF